MSVLNRLRSGAETKSGDITRVRAISSGVTLITSIPTLGASLHSGLRRSRRRKGSSACSIDRRAKSVPSKDPRLIIFAGKSWPATRTRGRTKNGQRLTTWAAVMTTP